MAKLRWRNRLRSTIGCASPSSQMTRNTKPSADSSAVVTMNGEANQSSVRPRSSVNCRQPMATASRIRPRRSTGRRVLGVSRPRNMVAVTATTAMPTGALTRKIQGQLKSSVSQPPSTGPATGPAMLVMAHIDSASVRLSDGKMATSSAWLSGTMGPDTMPCSTRKASSDSKFCATPHSTEASVKAATDSTNRRTCPSRRDSQPVRGMQMELAMAKKVMAHSPFSGLTPRLPEMVGTETLAMVMSTTAMKDARLMATAATTRGSPVIGSMGRGAADITAIPGRPAPACRRPGAAAGRCRWSRPGPRRPAPDRSAPCPPSPRPTGRCAAGGPPVPWDRG
ncbi:Uncharacterised protein [Achromobacter xylosoxidans]|nr:Uncharacterised protein [Achromobacter xylosoxidans]